MALKIRILLLAMGCFFLGINPIKGQSDSLKPANKILYFEFLGIGGFQSLNYERVIFRALDSRILGSFAVGTSCLIANKPHDPEFRFLLLQRANLAFGHKSWYLETGVDLILDRGKGYATVIDRWEVWTSNFSFLYHVGIRHQKVSSGLFFKAYLFRMMDDGLNMYFLSNIGKETNFDGYMYWWAGLAAGYSF